MKKKTSKCMSLLLTSAIAASILLTGCGNSNTSSPAGNSSANNVSQDTSSNPVKIVFGNYGSSAMPPYKADQDAIKYIEDASNGTITFEYSADGVLGSEYDMVQQLMDGTIQGSILAMSTFSTYTDKMEVFQLPFLIGDYDTEYTALTSDQANAIFEEVGNELGLKIVAVQENGLRHFANNKRPINSLADLKGLKLRIAPSNMLTEVMTNLGANPMVVAYNDIYSALQNNVVDGEEVNLTSMYAMKHYEVLDYVSLIGMYPFPSCVVYNLDFWNSLSPEQQEIITKGHQAGSEALFTTYLPEYEEEATAAIEDASTQINTISDEEREKFVEIAKPTWETYKEKDPLLKDFIEYVETLNESK